jgi:hypothetical protein
MNTRLVVGIIFMITLGMTTTFGTQLSYASHLPIIVERSAPINIDGENVYIAWWTNNTANNNEEVMFRVSTDGGQTFGDKINLSNTTDAHSTRVDIDADAGTVVVTWWETNHTSDIPVARVSNDNGQTFGPLLLLGANGTIGSAAGEE